MNLPDLGQVQNNYQVPNDPAVKKKLILFGGGIAVLIIALIFVLTSGGSGKPGSVEMRASLQATSDSLGIIDEYSESLQNAEAKNNLALIQIILRGNFQKINDLYNTTFNPKQKLSSSPRVDSKSKETLDRSKRNNTLDNDIVKVLKPKISEAKKQTKAARPSFNIKDSVQKIETTAEDLESIEDILNRMD